VFVCVGYMSLRFTAHECLISVWLDKPLENLLLMLSLNVQPVSSSLEPLRLSVEQS
jgi:hypothetical protein